MTATKRCLHDAAEPVTLTETGETVAYLCLAPDCLTQLDVDFADVLQRRRDEAAFRAACTHDDHIIEIRQLSDIHPWGLCNRCGAHMTSTPTGAWEPA